MTRPQPQADAPVPDRGALERYAAELSRDKREDALNRAQEVIYDAWDSAQQRTRLRLARKALTISPLCADAYNILADAAESPEEARDLYDKGVDAGTLALGPEGFKEYAGHFWGVLETRPYMRAREGLARTLIDLGDTATAIEVLRATLKLNPNDNQGLRYVLLSCLLNQDDTAALKKLLAAYKREWSVWWLYTRALIGLRDGHTADKKTLRLVQNAWSANHHVPGMLAGTTPLAPSERGYITVGGADEATEYVAECGAAWHRTPGAVAWLTELVAAWPTLPRGPTAMH